MSKKHTHWPVPAGNQPKYGVNPRKPANEVDRSSEVEQKKEGQIEEGQITAIEDDVADEKGRIHPPILKK